MAKNDVLSVIPKSIPAAKDALAIMAIDIAAAQTYEAIRKIERAAEAMKVLFAEVDEVRQTAERVIVLANHRIGEEMRTLTPAKAGRKPNRPSEGADSSTPSLKEQVGSKNRGLRLKQLGAIPPDKVAATVNELQAAGKEATVNAVINAVRGEGKAERRQQKLKLVSSALPKGKFNVIYADPPWRFEPRSRETGMDRAADNHYATMPLEQICELPVEQLAADDCVIFLWATAPMLPEALHTMGAWGFEYVSHLVWHKDRIGTGYWFRSRHELLLVGTRGMIPAPVPGTQPLSVFAAPVTEHSEKPGDFRRMIERLFPDVPRIELFAREEFEGWTAWGNEVPEPHNEELAEAIG